MSQRTDEQIEALVEELGPAERLLELFLNFPDHLWHNRPGFLDGSGRWKYDREALQRYNESGQVPRGLRYQPAGPNEHAIVQVYGTIADIYKVNEELAARLASYVATKTTWRDIKVVCAAFMLVQNRSGEPVFDENNGKRELLFHDDDFREVGEAMLKTYERGSAKMLSPKMIARIGDVLSLPGVVAINKELGFGNVQKRKPFTGRYYKAVEDWLRFREMNIQLLEGLKKAGYAKTVKNLARMVGYKPESQRFFEILNWPQKQHEQGHRSVGLGELNRESLSFENKSEAEICALIVDKQLGYKQVTGMLPPEIGLSPAIFVAVLEAGGVSDRDLAILTPTLEDLGLLKHEEIRKRWQDALKNLDDQRARNIAKNVRNRENVAALEDAADGAVKKAVDAATEDADIHIVFLIDTSASMSGAIEKSKEALAGILQGFEPEKLHVVAFDTVGTVLRLRHPSRRGVEHMLSRIEAGGGTVYGSGVRALKQSGVTIPDGADLIVFAVGDEAGESGAEFAKAFRDCGFDVSAFAHIVNVAWSRGETVRKAAVEMKLPYTEVDVDQFSDVYQVQRSLQAILKAQPLKSGKLSLVEEVLRTQLLTKPY